MLKHIQFNLVKSTDNRFYWTVELPTQIQKSKSRKEVEKLLANIVHKLLNRKFRVAEFDLTNGKVTDYFGGIRQLLTKVNDEDASGHNRSKAAPRAKKPKKRHFEVFRVTRRPERKVVRRVSKPVAKSVPRGAGRRQL